MQNTRKDKDTAGINTIRKFCSEPGKQQKDSPDINSAIFSLEEIASLRTEFCTALDKTSEELLALIIKARKNIDANLRRKAANLMEDVRESAKQKWIKEQTSDEFTFNRLDNILPVMSYDSSTRRKFPVPLSAVIFRTAMKECRNKVCLDLEKALQLKSEAHAILTPRDGCAP